MGVILQTDRSCYCLTLSVPPNASSPSPWMWLQGPSPRATQATTTCQKALGSIGSTSARDVTHYPSSCVADTILPTTIDRKAAQDLGCL